MKKEELKKILRPLVKECVRESIHEALFESGVITSIISEVVEGMNIPQLLESVSRTQITEVKQVPQPVKLPMTAVMNGSPNLALQEQQMEHKRELLENKRRLEENLGKSMGINVFEGTTPVVAEATADSQRSPLSGVDPRDPGVNLSNIPGLSTLNFSRHIK